MLSKTKLKNAAIAARSAALPKIPNELIDQFVTGPMTGEAVNAASMAFKKALIERAMGAELGHHLGYPAGAAKPEAAANQRNGRSAKTVLTGEGPVRIEVPRDRDGSFEPVLIPKHERRLTRDPGSRYFKEANTRSTITPACPNELAGSQKPSSCARVTCLLISGWAASTSTSLRLPAIASRHRS